MYLIAALLFAATPALAINSTQSPSKVPVPWGSVAAVNTYIRTIPIPSQIGITNCAASFTDGFPPQTFVPVAAGGCPPFGQDMNGILQQITLWLRWQAAGGPTFYDSSFSAAIAGPTALAPATGYPKGATLANLTLPGCSWISTADNNTSNPDSGGANWTASCPGGGIGGTSTGTANAQVVTATNFVLQVGATVDYTVGIALGNTSALTLNINGGGVKAVFRVSQLGATSTMGGETVAGQRVSVKWDGTEWQLQQPPVVVGEIRDFAGSSAPAGWAFIDGSCIAQAGFADLFSVVGSNYGSCSAGSFALPDGRGRVLAGKDNMGTNGAANQLTNPCVGSTLGIKCGNQNYSVLRTDLPNVTIAIHSGQGSHAHGGSTTGTNPSAGAGSFSPPSAGSNFGFGTITVNAATLPAMATDSINGAVTQTQIPQLAPMQVVTKIIRY